jgi:predicted permease
MASRRQAADETDRVVSPLHGHAAVSLLTIFATAILPVIAVAGAGFLLGRFKDVDPTALNTITVFVLAPALVVHSLATTPFPGTTLVRITAGTVAFSVVMILLAEAFGRFSGQTEPLLGAFVLVAAFPNVGNFGIPLSEFAFGQTGRSTAILVTALQGVLIYTVGVYIAARGDDDTGLGSMKRVFSIPLVYAVVVALAARWLGLVPPADSTAMETIETVGIASIPVMLLILGIQLSNVDVDETITRVTVASGAKLLVAPLVGLAVALVVGFQDPVVARTFVLLTGAPAAITPVILVGAFSSTTGDTSPGQYVSTSVLVTTLGSVVTITLLISVLQSGLLV